MASKCSHCGVWLVSTRMASTLMMKRGLSVLVLVVAILALALLLVRITGLNPTGPRPGLWLSGVVVVSPVSDWSFSNGYPTIDVQTSTWYLLPHSVTIWGAGTEHHLYLQALGKWKHNVARDPRIRIKIGNNLYDRNAVYVTDPTEYWLVAESMNKKYRGQWLMPKEVLSDVYLRVADTD